MEIAVSVKDISKKYSLYKDPWGPIKEVVTRKKLHKDFFALNNVSLNFPKGESIGILGKNGSGKSTLLKIITGITEPTSGKLDVFGSIVFLDVSSGIDSELSGYENIFMKGILLGYSKDEMLQKVDDIVAFSELGEFIGQPVKNYSSGMKSKLGFAISVNVDPDILIVDEALAVGDSVFRAKCMNKMNEFKAQGKTIIFVSHDNHAIEAFCSKAAWIHEGELVTYGEAKFVGSLYEDYMAGRKQLNSILSEIKFNHSIEKVSFETIETGLSVELSGFIRDSEFNDIHERFNLVVKDNRTGEFIVKPFDNSKDGFVVKLCESEVKEFFIPGKYSFLASFRDAQENANDFTLWAGNIEIEDKNINHSKPFNYIFEKKGNTLELHVDNHKKLEEQVNRIWFEGNRIHIEGVAFIRGYETKSEDAVTMTFSLVNQQTFKKIDFPLEVTETEEVTENPSYNPQGKVYNFSKFSISLDFTELEYGKYESYIKYEMNHEPFVEVMNLVWASKSSQYPDKPYVYEKKAIEIKTATRYLQLEKIRIEK